VNSGQEATFLADIHPMMGIIEERLD